MSVLMAVLGAVPGWNGSHWIVWRQGCPSEAVAVVQDGQRQMWFVGVAT